MTTRDNGLYAGSYVFLGSVTPAVAPELLAELREEGIAGYTVPADPQVHRVTRAMADIQLPAERLYVDRVSASYAQVLVRRRLAEYERSASREPPEPLETPRANDAASSDEDEVWRRIVADYERQPEEGERSWPAAEDIEPEASQDDADTETRTAGVEAPTTAPNPPEQQTVRTEPSNGEEVDEEHYVPPPPPPLPKEDPLTKAAFAGIGLGLATLCVVLAFDWARQWWIVLLTVAVLAAGVVIHVLRIRDPRNPGSDNGAQV